MVSPSNGSIFPSLLTMLGRTPNGRVSVSSRTVTSRRPGVNTGRKRETPRIRMLSAGLVMIQLRELVLVEAKAHLGEIGSNCSAKEAGRGIIRKAFERTQDALSVNTSSDWTEKYYQYANRVACLHLLTQTGLLPICFLSTSWETHPGPQESVLKQRMNGDGRYQSRMHTLASCMGTLFQAGFTRSFFMFPQRRLSEYVGAPRHRNNFRTDDY